MTLLMVFSTEDTVPLSEETIEFTCVLIDPSAELMLPVTLESELLADFIESERLFCVLCNEGSSDVARSGASLLSIFAVGRYWH